MSELLAAGYVRPKRGTERCDKAVQGKITWCRCNKQLICSLAMSMSKHGYTFTHQTVQSYAYVAAVGCFLQLKCLQNTQARAPEISRTWCFRERACVGGGHALATG